MSSILGILDPFFIINTDSPASFKAAGHRSRYFCRLQLQHKTSALALNPTHCSRNKHLARPDINKKKQKETIFLPRLVCLLRNEIVNKYYQLQKGEDSAHRNKPMSYMQYIPQSCWEKKKKSINHTALISINYTTAMSSRLVDSSSSRFIGLGLCPAPTSQCPSLSWTSHIFLSRGLYWKAIFGIRNPYQLSFSPLFPVAIRLSNFGVTFSSCLISSLRKQSSLVEPLTVLKETISAAGS